MLLRSTTLLPPIICIAAFLFAPTSVRAQDWHPVGSGTSTNGANGIPCPFGDIYAGQRAQYVYLASELSAAGLSAGDSIVRVRWVVTALNGSGLHENYTIQIGATTATSLSGFLETPAGASTTPRDHQPTMGHNDFTLNSPFVWNGTSNLLVEVTHFSPTYGTASANASVAFTSTAPVKRSFSLLDDLMFTADQMEPLDPALGETLNSTGLPNIVLGVASNCAPLTTTDYSVCTDGAIPQGEGVSVSGCTETLGGRFTSVYNFPGTDLACTGTDYVLRTSVALAELPTGAVVQAGRLILTDVQAPDPVWMSDLFLKLTGSIEGEIQLMPNHENYSGTIPELIVAITGPYVAGVVELQTACTYETGYIGSARVEFDYLLPTPFWYDAPTGGNLVAYGESTVNPVALGLANTAAPGTTVLYTDCGVPASACRSTRVPANFYVVPPPVASFTVNNATVMPGEETAFTNTSSGGSDYAWDFGDGTTSTEAEPTHAWATPGVYPVTLIVDNGACVTFSSIMVTVAAPTGISAGNELAGLRVFGTAGDLVIDHPFGNQPVQVEVLDAVGRPVRSKVFIAHPDRFRIPADDLASGVWFVHVECGDVQRTFRVPLVR